MADTPIEQQGFGAGARAAKQAGEAAAQAGKSIKETLLAGGIAAKVWKEVKAAIRDTIGPMALLGAASVGVVKVLARMVVSSEQLRRSIQRYGRMEALERDFAGLLKGMDAAKKRLAEIERFSRKSPFAFEDAAQASRTLEAFGLNAFASGKGLRVMGDAAAVAGIPMGSMADTVGNMYETLRSGQSIAPFTSQLEKMGVISAGAKNQIDSLQASGAGFAQVWGAIETALATTSGNMDKLSRSLEGLQQRMENAAAATEMSIGAMFAEGEKRGMEGAIASLEGLHDVTLDAVRPIAAVTNFFKGLWAAIVEGVAKSDTLKGALSEIITVLQAGLVFGLLAAAKTTISFTMQMLGAARGLGFVQAACWLAVKAFGALRTAMLLLAGSNPILLALTAIAAAAVYCGVKMAGAAQRADQFRESLKDEALAAREAIEALKDKAKAIETLEDRTAVMTELLEKAANAEIRLAQARGRAASAYRSEDNHKIAEAMAEVASAQNDFTAAQIALNNLPANGLARSQRENEQELDRQRAMREIAEESSVRQIEEMPMGTDKVTALKKREAEKYVQSENAASAMNALDKAQNDARLVKAQRAADQSAMLAEKAQKESDAAFAEVKAMDVAGIKDPIKRGRLLDKAWKQAEVAGDARVKLRAAQATRNQIADELSNNSELFAMGEDTHRARERGATPREIQDLQNKLDLRKEELDPASRAKEAESAKQARMDAERQMSQAKAEAASDADRLKYERLIASLRSQGLERAKEESRLALERLKAERKRIAEMESAVKSGDVDKIAAVGATGLSADQVSNMRVANAVAIEAQKQADIDSQRRQRLDVSQTIGGARVDMMRRMERLTGDTSYRTRADEEEDRLKRQRYTEEGKEFLNDGDASSYARLRTEEEGILREQDRAGTPRVSSLAAIGGSAGFAGMVNDIPKQQLERLKVIEQTLKAIEQKSTQEDYSADEHYQ